MYIGKYIFETNLLLPQLSKVVQPTTVLRFNVDFQNVDCQNVDCQNVDCQNVDVQKVDFQNVEWQF
jgi:uncharacterized protein YjbI with pentapeptide repeats